MADDVSTGVEANMPEKISPAEARQHKVITQVNGRQWGTCRRRPSLLTTVSQFQQI